VDNVAVIFNGIEEQIGWCRVCTVELAIGIV
jgi:hypothetical protein